MGKFHDVKSMYLLFYRVYKIIKVIYKFIYRRTQTNVQGYDIYINYFKNEILMYRFNKSTYNEVNPCDAHVFYDMILYFTVI